MIRTAGWLYGVLLWALPPRDRRRFGAEMAIAFKQACEAARAKGRRRALRVAGRSLADLLLQLPREWRAYLFNRIPPRHALPRPRKGRDGMFDRVSRDLRQAVRCMRRSPSYSVLVVATLAVGIGASTAIFSVAQGVLLAPLPYPDADGIVTIGEVSPEIDIPPIWVSIPNWDDYRRQVDGITDLSLFRGRSMSITEGDEPFYVYGALVTAEFFRVFGAEPVVGRAFDPSEIGADPADVVVLGYDLWQRGFAGDRDIVGASVQIDGTPRTVIGVMPEGFDAPGEWIAPAVAVEVWTPFPLEVVADERINRSFHAVGRLRDGVALARARQQLATVFEGLRAEYPEANRLWQTELLRWHTRVAGDVHGAIELLWVAVSLVLLVACVNVAGLLFGRLLGRRHELAVRKALGASRARLLQSVATESVVLALLGGVLGIGLAAVGLEAMLYFEPGRLPLRHRIGIDGTVLLVTLATSVVAGLLFGLLPAGWATRRRSAHLGHGGRATGGGRGTLWTVVVGAQVALAFVVAIGAALLGRSFSQLVAVPSGIDGDQVMTATVALSWDRVATLEERSRFIRDVLDRVTENPMVESAAEINSLPFSGSNSWGAVWLDGRAADDPSRQPVAAFRNVSSGYLETMRIPLLRGRWLRQADMQEVGAAVVNEAFVDNYWPQLDPLGRTVAINEGQAVVRVVGVVGNVRHFGLDSEAQPEIYLPYTIDGLTSKTFVVRSTAAPATVRALLRRAIVEVDPDQPLRDLRPMREVIAQTVAGPRFNALMMAVAAAIAVGLAALGLFGTISYMVAERTRELGIRLALGGTRRRVLGTVLAQGGRLTAGGIIVGAVVALASSRLSRGLLFEVPSADPLSYAGVALVFALVALLASYLPARRASRVDPAIVMSEQ